MFVFFAIVLPLAFLALFLGLVLVRLRQLRREHEREMRIQAREIGELERLGPATGVVLFGLRDETAQDR